jgi:hypothetical protein
MRNRFAGRCFRCGCEVKAGEGHFQRDSGKWLVRCKSCVGKGNEPEPVTPDPPRPIVGMREET